MPEPKETLTPDGRRLHYTVGALIQRHGKYLLIDLAKPPFGFAPPAGHIDVGETPEEAMAREVREEETGN